VDDGIRARVLIIDDEKSFAEIIAELLIDEGYTVQRAYDGLQAMSQLASRTPGNPDVLICDVMLPGLRGDELATRIRDEYPRRRLPIVLLSAGGDPKVALRDVWFMAKPLDFVDLLALVERVSAPASCPDVAAC
jgi:CheY-like chemotaxis protein